MMTRKTLRRLPPFTRAIAGHCNTLETTTRKLRRMLTALATIENQIAAYTAHMERLKKHQEDLKP